MKPIIGQIAAINPEKVRAAYATDLLRKAKKLGIRHSINHLEPWKASDAQLQSLDKKIRSELEHSRVRL